MEDICSLFKDNEAHTDIIGTPVTGQSVMFKLGTEVTAKEFLDVARADEGEQLVLADE